MSSLAKATLLSRLLEAHERSASFGRAGPWKRDVILRFDRRGFPSAFAPDGREEREALVRAALDLEVAGAARLARHSGLAQGEIREIRMGAAEVDAAYREAAPLGFVRLADALRSASARATQLASTTSTDWGRVYLLHVVEGLGAGDTSPLGMSRDRFKREAADVEDSLIALATIANGAKGWERIVSERIFGRSKRLASIRGLVASLLICADPRWGGLLPDPETDVLETYGIRRRPAIIRCAGGAAFDVVAADGEVRSYELSDFSPTAHLPDAWADALAAGVVRTGPRIVTTIENEYPFLSYCEDEGGPNALAARGELVVYTAGFPGAPTLNLLRALARGCPQAAFRHWGDADVGGLRIWALLREALDTPVQLFRTTAEWFDREVRVASTPLTRDEERALHQLRATIRRWPDASDALALTEALLAARAKVEQERF